MNKRSADRSPDEAGRRPRWLEVPEYVRLHPDIPPPGDDALDRRRLRRQQENAARRDRWRRQGLERLAWTVLGLASVTVLATGIRLFGARHSAADSGAAIALPKSLLAPGEAVGSAQPRAASGDSGAPGGNDHAETAAERRDAAGGSAADTDVPRETDVPPATPIPPTSPPEAEVPIVPTIDAALKDRLRAIHAAGLERGRQAGVFAKLGDSITVSTYFLTELGCGNAYLGEASNLAATIDFFAATQLEGPGASDRCDIVNAFTRSSVAAGRGWIAVQVLTPMGEPPAGCEAPNDTPLRCEIVKTRPSVALVMFGTNDLHQGIGLRSFQASMTTIVRELVDFGVIPVLSTIPHRGDSWAANARVGDYNAVIRSVAASEQVPLWNYWRAVAGDDMVQGGLEPDGVHPNAQAHGANLSGKGLRYGYNQRNLTALQVLDKIRRIVIEDGPAD